MYLAKHKLLVIFFLLSAWYEVTGRKQPHSPTGDDSACLNDTVQEPASKGAGTLYYDLSHILLVVKRNTTRRSSEKSKKRRRVMAK